MMRKLFVLIFLAGWLLVGCGDGDAETAVTAVPPTPTSAQASTPAAVDNTNRSFIVVATDAPNPPFTEFDAFGNVTGFVQRLMGEIAASAGLDYEFVVTPYQGVLDSIAAGSNRDFDAVMSHLVIPETPAPGIVYTDPYLEVGQVMVTLVDENRLVSARDVQPEMRIGVPGNTFSEDTARGVLGLGDAQIDNSFASSVQALQALIDEAVTAVIIESYTADYFVETYPDRLKIVGGNGRDAWISSRAYGIAVAADNQTLLDQLNAAIADTAATGALTRIAVELIPEESFRPGESRAGTPPNQLVIGVLGDIADMDPAGAIDLISWEVKGNTMSGLYRIGAEDQIEPLLATSMPTISEDKLTYTISLRQGVRFSDGSELTADDVKWSIDRARSLGSFLVNGYLKDSDDNGFADDDAVQVIDQYTLRFVLQEPTAYFLSLLATPPYFPISNECYAVTLDPDSDCGGIGPYTILSWQPGEQMQLQANPEWPGRPAPAFENIVLRFFDDAAAMTSSLEKFQSIDMAWTGFPYVAALSLSQIDAAGDGAADFRLWQGPTVFKSYIIFDHAAAPWDSEKVRQAAALALDRDELAALFDGLRAPLLSPIPDTVPGYQPVLPARNLPEARALLLEEGYSQSAPLAIELWYTNDGRYSPIEDLYAAAIKDQLEETGVFQVTLQNENSDVFRAQVAGCSYPAYLIGWPSPGSPTNYLDVTSWTDFFVQNTSSGFCSNYDGEAMLEQVQAAREELDSAARLALYAEIQQRWAEELPTLELLQERRFAVALPTIENVTIDALGLMHYETLTKGAGG